jgi:hypothetical protein
MNAVNWTRPARTIRLYAADGALIASEAVRANCKRSSMQAAAEHKQMDELIVHYSTIAVAVRATLTIDGELLPFAEFVVINGRSSLVIGE